MILPVILCGGSGTRLWPLSRKAYPKQLLALSGRHSMLQETMLRLADIPNLLPPIVICNEAHRFIVAEQFLELGITNPKIMLEPYAKNTAPAVALAALAACENATLLILPADHQIKNIASFCQSVLLAEEMAAANYLVTFGIAPVRADTGYGYIKIAEKLMHGFKVEKFIEKPNLEKAESYLASNEYYWNSGMFMFQAATYLNELKRVSPEMVSVCEQSLFYAKQDMDFIRIDKTLFEQCENISIDYAVMEKSQTVAVIPLKESGWSDLGSWDAIYDFHLK